MGFKGGKKGRKGPVIPVGPPRVVRQVDLPGGGVLTDKVGDLFSTKGSLCHCVSKCLGMGKGIAVKFKQDFGGVDELRSQGPSIGGVCTLQRDDRFVYYLITKSHYSDKPTYDDFTSSLTEMAKHMKANGVKEISMPKIGCGLDKLQWDRVTKIIGQVFDFPIAIDVYHLEDPTLD